MALEALEARTNLQFSIFTLQLVERFVSERGRWPRAWSDLDGVPMREGPFGRKWPAASTDLQRHISIDFVLDPYDVVRQDPMSFTAIRSIGPYYEHGDVAYVESLQHGDTKVDSPEQPWIVEQPVEVISEPLLCADSRSRDDGETWNASSFLIRRRVEAHGLIMDGVR